jgi:hypothetical protein
MVMRRDGSFALAFLGRTRRLLERFFSVAFGRLNLELKRIVDLVAIREACFPAIARTLEKHSEDGGERPIELKRIW